MTVPIFYRDERWDNAQRFGIAGVHRGERFEACIVCCRRVFVDRPHWRVELCWSNNEAMTADDPREKSQGSFPIGPDCLRQNPQLKPHVERVN